MKVDKKYTHIYNVKILHQYLQWTLRWTLHYFFVCFAHMGAKLSISELCHHSLIHTHKIRLEIREQDEYTNGEPKDISPLLSGWGSSVSEIVKCTSG